MRPAPTVPLALTAAELRALAGVHNSFADAADDFGLYVQAGDGRDRADLLRRVAEQVGPPAMARRWAAGDGPMNAAHNPRQDAATAIRAELWDAGWRPVALYSWDCGHAWLQPGAPGKRPAGKGWQDRARRDPPEAADATPEPDALETGILCDGLRALDLDIDDSLTWL